jgi:predicted metal-dependent HD superfamily phosphohydrolase
MRAIYHAANPIDAQLAVDRLAAEGIAAHVQGAYLSGGVGELPAGDLLRVWVADEDAVRALAALAAATPQPVADDALDPRLERSWRRAWAGIGARGDGLDLRDALLSAWAEPQRRYHTLRHLVDSLDLLEPALGTATHPAEVELALWFHDAVYALRGKDNEAQSAAWASRSLHAAGVAPEPAARVVALVLATRHAALPASDDERLLVDVDLAILGTATAVPAQAPRDPAGLPRPRRDLFDRCVPVALRSRGAREPRALDQPPAALVPALGVAVAGVAPVAGVAGAAASVLRARIIRPSCCAAGSAPRSAFDSTTTV